MTTTSSSSTGTTLRVLQPHTLGLGRGVRIAATGSYLPERVVDNAAIVARGCPLTVEEIERLTGIRERRFAADGEATSDLAARAIERALARVKDVDELAATVDRLIVATGSPDHPVPSCACVTQHKLDALDARFHFAARGVPSLDVTAACSGFVYALDVGVRAVLTGDRRVVCAAADIRSRFVDPLDRSTAALFGDGAGAALLEPCAPGQGIVAIATAADGRGHKTVYLPAGGSAEPASADTVARRRHFLSMADGPQVYLSAVEGMLETGTGLLGALGLGFDDVAFVVPHQPNRRLLERMARLGGVPLDKLVVDVDRTGNVSGASCAIALDELLAGRAGARRPRAGDRVLLLVAGAGYTAGAALLVVDDALLETASEKGT